MLNNSITSLPSSLSLSSTQSPIDSLHTCGQTFLNGALEQFGWLFYLITPNSSTFSTPHDVPNYEVQIFPAFGLLISIEQIIRFFQRKRASRMSDLVLNMGAGLLFVVMRVLLLGTVLRLFYFLYDNYRIIDLPKTCISTWILSLLLIEFVYYWVHRSLHEINIFWASHQFHHNAVELDVSTTLRDTIVDLVIYEFFPTPLALIIPPPILLVHMQFSLIYQVWLHTEVVYNLGPIEYIINTPRQHRVHHGKNPYCIDKNFGALIMIWDRVFGTYQSEEEKIVFGTTTKPYETFDTITLHFYYYYETVWHKFKSMDGWKNKFCALFYGPGWAPGKPRLGLVSELPKVDPYSPIDRYDRNIPFWQTFYVMMHGFLIILGFYIVTDHPLIKYNQINAFIIFFYVLVALTSFGTIFDRRSIAPLIESIRCLLFFVFDNYVITSWQESTVPSHLQYFTNISLTIVRLIHLLSIVIWLIVWLNRTNDCNKNYDKQSLMKEDKYINSYTDININNVNRRHFWQTLIFIVGAVFAISYMWFIFALRFDECTHFLRESKVDL